MTLQTLYDQLLELRIPAFRQALQEQQSNPQYSELAFEERLALLVDHECTQRRENRIRRNLQAAAFPLSASLEELDLSPARGLERRTMLELGQCNWIPARQNIIILGPTGSGNSYLTSAFGRAAIRNGFTVRYHRTARLLHILNQVRSEGSLTSTLRSLARCNLLILDDWMRDAVSTQDAQNILEVLDDRFGNTATLIATQVPINEWHARAQWQEVAENRAVLCGVDGDELAAARSERAFVENLEVGRLPADGGTVVDELDLDRSFSELNVNHWARFSADPAGGRPSLARARGRDRDAERLPELTR